MKNHVNRIRNGAVLPFVAVLLGVLILILGLTVEQSWFQSTRFEVQSASDLAVRSALAELYANEDELDQAAIDRAKQTGREIYELNYSRSEPLTDDNFDFGTVRLDGEFDETAAFQDITAARIESDQQFVSLLGTLIAKDRMDLNTLSIAEAGRVDLVLALDASRSMNSDASGDRRLPPGANSINEPPVPGSRWFALEDAVESFLDIISDDNVQLGLTTFGGGERHRFVSPLDATWSRIEFELGSVEENGDRIEDKLQEYVGYSALGSGTSIYDGVDQAIDVLGRSTTPAKRFIILLTDGRQVRDVRPSELEAARRAAEEGITIFVIAYAVDEKNLGEMASITDGQIFSVSDSDELISAFGKIAATLQTRLTK